MAEPEGVTQLPRQLPREVPIDPADIGFSVREMRALRVAAGGRSLGAILANDDPAEMEDRTQALVWIELYRLGLNPSWEDAEIPIARFKVPLPPDPTSAA